MGIPMARAFRGRGPDWSSARHSRDGGGIVESILSKREIEQICKALIDGWPLRVGLSPSCFPPFQFAVKVEEVTLDPQEDLGMLELSSPVRAQRIRATLLDHRAMSEKLLERGGVSPEDGTFMILDIASADVFHKAPGSPYSPYSLTLSITRLPVQYAALVPISEHTFKALLVLFKEIDPSQYIFIGRAFRPLDWTVWGGFVWLLCPRDPCQ
jgi:hypothetical protein